MVKLTVLGTLTDLEQEMARAGRHTEQAALREAVRALSHQPPDHLTIAQAAERVGVSAATIKHWIERGTLDGTAAGGSWIVSTASVERVLRLRSILDDLDQEGNPTPDELRMLYRSAGR